LFINRKTLTDQLIFGIFQMSNHHPVKEVATMDEQLAKLIEGLLSEPPECWQLGSCHDWIHYHYNILDAELIVREEDQRIKLMMNTGSIPVITFCTCEDFTRCGDTHLSKNTSILMTQLATKLKLQFAEEIVSKREEQSKLQSDRIRTQRPDPYQELVRLTMLISEKKSE
jgi:hypothetical protein